MRHILEVLRLKHQYDLSIREIARSIGLSTSTVGDYLRRFQSAGLGWPLPEGLSEGALQDQLLGRGAPESESPAPAERPLPDWSRIHAELRRMNGTLQLRWQQYQVL